VPAWRHPVRGSAQERLYPDRSSASGALSAVDGALSDCSLHIIERGPPARLNDAFQLRRTDFWKDHDAAVRMHEEFDSVAGFEMKMIPNGLGDSCLSFYAERGFHCVTSLHFTECNASSCQNYSRQTHNYRD